MADKDFKVKNGIDVAGNANIDGNLNAAKYQDSAPSSPVNGQIWIDSNATASSINTNDFLLKADAVSTYVPLLGNFRIKQIVQGTTTTSATSSSSTYADTGLTATITPSSASNKIIVLYYHGQISKSSGNANTGFRFQLLRGATQIDFAFSLYTATAVDLMTPGFSGMVFDAPATTSATVYKTQFANSANVANVRINGDSSTARIILIEVEG
jgi:hypothetical protein